MNKINNINKYFSLKKWNEPANTTEKQGYSANFKFTKRLSTEEAPLNEIRKFTSFPLSTHQSQCPMFLSFKFFFPQHITGYSSIDNKIIIEEHLYFLEPSLQKMVETFQNVPSSHYENSGQTLHDTPDMRKFSETHAPGLFNVLLSSILRDDSWLSEERKTLQEQRTGALLHIMTYFR